MTHPRTAITIGNFDGVHRGHQALVRAARNAVGEDGRVIALFFDPSPRRILRPSSDKARLSTPSQRSRWLRKAGADEAVRIEPTIEFLRQSAEEFIERIVERWRPGFVVEGVDFRFGRDRQGSIAMLQAAGAAQGFRTIAVDPVEICLADQSLAPASSSLLRWLISHGRVLDAAKVLGRPYEIESAIVRGEQRGRDLGFPTANLEVSEHVLPADGIYAGIAQRIENDESIGAYAAAISVGANPTFGQGARTCEAFLLDYAGPPDDYGWCMRLQFCQWLRDQVSFENTSGLIAQIERDVNRVRTGIDYRGPQQDQFCRLPTSASAP